jgi:hypothetical protein
MSDDRRGRRFADRYSESLRRPARRYDLIYTVVLTGVAAVLVLLAVYYLVSAANAHAASPAVAVPVPAASEGSGASDPTTPMPGARLVSAAVPPLRGYATFDAGQGGLHNAAAGPALRERLGAHWRGSTVSVCYGSRCLDVWLTDWCACGDRHGRPTLIDLDDSGFRYLTHDLGLGVIPVTIAAGQGRPPSPTLPPTDTAP